MSQSRKPVQVLREARQRDSREKRGRVLAAVDQLVAAGEPITFTAVKKAANVSHWLVYADGMREHIEAARSRQARMADSQALVEVGAPTGWKVERQLLREDNGRLRGEIERLKAAIRRSLGQQLDQIGAADLGKRVDELTADNQRLQGDISRAQKGITNLTEQLREAHDDLAAARNSIRQLIRSENGSSGK